MTFQEQYFAKHHNSPYKDLADNITHPFNEYLLILTNYGILGLSILLIVILSIYIYKKTKKNYFSRNTFFIKYKHICYIFLSISISNMLVYSIL